MSTLEEIQAKFDIVQEELEKDNNTLLQDVAGIIWWYVKANISFDDFFNERGYHFECFNYYLKRRKFPNLTEEEVRQVYEKTRENYQRNNSNK